MPFFKSHCDKCHGEKKQKGDVALHKLQLEKLGSEDADQAYLESNGTFKAMVISLLTSDSFLYRK